MELLTLKSNIPYTRYDDNYTVEVTSDFGVLDSNNGGQIRVRYPEDFYMDVFSGTCQTEDRFSLYSFYNDYVFNSANKAYDFRQSGSLKFNINTHRNAEYAEYLIPQIEPNLNAGLTGPITIQNYDAINRLILARSFSTLSVSFMNFTYDGLQLQVNGGNPFSLEVGSLSDPINIGPIELMKQRLTVVPLYFDSNFIFSGTPVTLVPGTTGTGFRLAAPQTMLRKRFFLTFSKSGDLIQKFYAPIPKFPVDIVKGTLMRTVTPSVTLYINKGGISVPLYVDVPNPPYEVVTTAIAASDPTFILNATLLSFSKSTSRLYYFINESSSTFAGASLTLTLTLGGTDSSSYQLSTTSLNIPVQPADTAPAPFVDILIMENNRGNVKIKVKSNKLAYVYCATGYQFMPEPTYDMVKGRNLTSNYSYSKPLYHNGYVDTAAFEGIVVVDGLTPSYFYTTYCYTMNLNGVPSPTYSKLSFQNKLPQRIATFTMKINQPTVSQELREEYVKRLATLMQIETTRLAEKLFCKSEAPVGSEANTTYITYYVMPDPTNNEDDISPINLVRSLNKQRSNIVKFIPTLDPGNLLVMKEVKVTPPTFKTRPIMDRRGTDWMTVNITSSVCGYAMVAAQPIDGTRWLLSTNSTFFYFENQIIKGVYAADKEFYPYGIQNANGESNTFSKYGGSAYKPTNNSLRRRRLKVIEYTDLSLVERYPTAFQLNNTLNQTNLPEKLLFNKTIDDTSQVWTINVTGLQDNLIYNVYIGLVSDKPVYPDYMEQDYVAQINLKTVQRRTILNIYSINAGFWLRVSAGLLMSAFLMFLM